MGKADVQRALDKVTRLLDAAGIDYAVVGALALNEFGYERVTDDIDIVLTREGLDSFKKQWLGRGYLEEFPGSRGLRDTELNVQIDVVLAGDYPGDGKPKPVRFPNPASALRGERIRLMPLETLIELKIALRHLRSASPARSRRCARAHSHSKLPADFENTPRQKRPPQVPRAVAGSTVRPRRGVIAQSPGARISMPSSSDVCAGWV